MIALNIPVWIALITVPAAAQVGFVGVHPTDVNSTGNSSVVAPPRSAAQDLAAKLAITTNVALGRPADQSSAYGGATADKAVDGNTSGDYNGVNSVAITNPAANAWWQVDLGSSAAITSIVVWNRTDCCGDRLGNYWIFVSDIPFGPSDTPATLAFRAGTTNVHQTSVPNPSTAIAMSAQGRYVRVQLDGTNYLQLAEVQVMGTVSGPLSDLTITKTHMGTFFPGQIAATYSITVTNLGTGYTSGLVTVTDSVPAGLTPKTIGGAGWSCFPPSGPCLTSDSAGPGASYPPITLTVDVDPGAPPSVTNTAVVSGGGDSNSSNNIASDPTTIATNLALGRPASQSSTFNIDSGPEKAVDGNTSGDYPATPSMAITAFTATPWWQVDLGSSATIGSVVVWNRTSCCGDRLSDYWIFISDTPFGPSDTPSTLQNRPGTFSRHLTVAPNPNTAIPTPFVQGRYVRIQLNGTNYLSLAEVQVLGTSGPVQPDLAITKSHNGNFLQGQVGAKYTIVVSNLGNAPTSGAVSVTDTLPAGLTATNISGTNWTTCTQPSGPCQRSDTLAAGSSYEPLILTVDVAANAPAAVTNLATVSGGGEPASGANNTAADPTTITTSGGVPPSNLAAGKSASQSTTFNANAGPEKAVDGNTSGDYPTTTSTAITAFTDTPWWQVDLGSSSTIGSIILWNRTSCCGDRLNDYWVFVSDTPFGSADTPATLQNRAGTWSIHLTSAPNPSTTIPVPSVGGRYVRVQLSGTNYLQLAEVQIIGVPAPAAPDLVISKTHSGSFTQGQFGATYTLTVTNGGTVSTTGTVSVAENPPAGLTVTAMAGSGWTCSPPAGPCTRTNSLAPGASYPPITVTVNVDPAAAATLTNGATVSGGGETNTTNNLAADPTTITPGGGSSANLALGRLAQQSSTFNPASSASKAVDGNTNGNYPGANSVSVTVSNTNAWWQVDLGTQAAIGSVVVWNRTDCCGDRLSDYWVFISSAPFLPTDTPAVLQNRVGTWGVHLTSAPNPNTAIPVPMIQGRYVRVQLTGTNYLQLAEVQVFGVAGSPAPDLTITKSHTGDFTRGQSGVVYTLTVTNAGTAPTGAMVTVTDSLPAGLTPVSIGGSNWSCTPVTGPCSRSDSLNPGLDYEPILITANVAANAPAVVTNTATVSGGGEIDTTNDTAIDATTVLPGPGPTNLAMGKSVTQSSTYAINTGPEKAVDGNTDGNSPTTNSIATTSFSASPWWQVDLGAPATIGSVIVWNRTDCCGDRLGDYWVFISDMPFGIGDSPTTLQSRAGTWSSHQTSAPNPSTTVSVPAVRGRYVRIQLSGTNFLSLAEVQVMSQ